MTRHLSPTSPGHEQTWHWPRSATGEIAGAQDALRPILDLQPDQRIGGTIPSVLRVAHAIQVPALAGAAETETVQGEIEEFVRRRPSVLPR